MATKKVISVIGYIDVDLCMTTLRLPDPGESLQAKSYTSSPGGKGANAAVAAFRSSHVKEHHGDASSFVFSSPFPEVETEVRMVGAVGDDAHGAVAKDNLAQNGVNIRGVRTFPGEVTGVCFAMIDAETGENRLLYTPGATDRLLPEDFATPEQLGCGVRPDLVVSQLEVRVEAVERLLRTAHEAGIDVLLNAAPARQLMLEVYQWVTHLIVNETEAAILTGVEVEKVNEKTWHSIAQEFLEDGVKNVVITLASRGAYYANAQDHGHVQAEKVTVVDSTGAGWVVPSSKSVNC